MNESALDDARDRATLLKNHFTEQRRSPREVNNELLSSQNGLPGLSSNKLRPPMLEDIQSADNEMYRGKTSTSSQRTLKYNDFELVQKKYANDPEYAIELDENDNKVSNQSKSPKTRN